MTRTVVITGASAGLGRALVGRFAREKANIALIARNPDRLRQAAMEAEQIGARALVFPLDVADADSVEEASLQIERQLGTIDVWINNAMATVFAPASALTAAEIRRATEVTYLGTTHGTLSALRRMRERDRGLILQVGSALAYRSIPLQAPYCGAKHAIVGFTDSLRSELLHDGSNIKLTIVHLPAMNTPQFDWARNKMGRRPQPVPPIFEPEVAADAIHYATLRPRREYWLGWPTAEAIVGQKVIPGLLDRYLARRGYDGQLTSERITGNPEGNLFAPVEGDFAAHGRFSARAKKRSSEWWFATHRGAVAGATLAIAAAALLSAFRSR